MSANFFKLPESDKRRIWAALLAEWQKKKARADGAACAAALAFGLHWRQWFRRGASRCRWWG